MEADPEIGGLGLLQEEGPHSELGCVGIGLPHATKAAR